jgi:hypothetical protein
VIQGVGDELRGQAAPGQREPGRGRRDTAADAGAATEHIGREGQGPEAAEHGERRPRAGVPGGRRGRQGGQRGHARDDPQCRQHLPRADALSEAAGADGQEHEQAEGERRLDHAQRREQQRDRLQRPPQHVEERAGQPAAPGRQPPQERRAQAVVAVGRPGLERLERDPDVVEARCAAGRGRAERRGRHG